MPLIEKIKKSLCEHGPFSFNKKRDGIEDLLLLQSVEDGLKGDALLNKSGK